MNSRGSLLRQHRKSRFDSGRRRLFPRYVSVGKEYGVPIVPIVSYAKLAKIAERLGASAIVVEGTEAGGHLGTQRSIKDILPEILSVVKIPVIAAGGAITGSDVADLLHMGASGVQMGSRFAASEESNGAPQLKEFYLKMTKDDVIQIDSPVGFKGRAVLSPFPRLPWKGIRQSRLLVTAASSTVLEASASSRP